MRQEEALSNEYEWVTRYLPGWAINKALRLWTALETDWGFSVAYLGIQREPFRVRHPLTCLPFNVLRASYLPFSCSLMLIA